MSQHLPFRASAKSADGKCRATTMFAAMCARPWLERRANIFRVPQKLAFYRRRSRDRCGGC